MSLSVLIGLAIALGAALLVNWQRRLEVRRMAEAVRTRERDLALGAANARLHAPIVDLSRCLGCGACVAACPEDRVLELVHGQAAVVRPARCVGVGECARACPVGAITVTIADLATRTDVPVLGAGLEALGADGLFLAGEVTAHALVKTAIEHGVTVAKQVADRLAASPHDGRADVADLCIVGAGPAGLACALECRRLGLSAIVLEKESEIGGTVAKYPRKKLVLTLPVELPLWGRLDRGSYTKEDLVAVWNDAAARHALDVRCGATLTGVARAEDGGFVLTTTRGEVRARQVCLAIGRRGVPNRLGVPGEDLAKVAYGLLDAASYHGRRIAVVGGGDSAVETALALAEQGDNTVTIVYRKEAFYRLRAANEERLEHALADRSLAVRFATQVAAIAADHVELVTTEGTERLPNDDVFVMAGGTPAKALLESAGVRFDPTLRKPEPPPGEQGPGLARALAFGMTSTLLAIAWVACHGDYYGLPAHERVLHADHATLRPGAGTGLGFGIACLGLVVVNLGYLLRRRAPRWFRFGSLQAWMTSHVATGILALLCGLLHAALLPRETPGGHALWALVALFASGAIGRYFYAQVPRAANGRELGLTEVRASLGREAAIWDAGRDDFLTFARGELDRVVGARQWTTSFFGRVRALLSRRRDSRQLVAAIEARAQAEAVPAGVVAETCALVRRGFLLSTQAAHLEDLRAVLATWRYLHRWVAAALLLLVVVHVAHALAYGSFFEGAGAR